MASLVNGPVVESDVHSRGPLVLTQSGLADRTDAVDSGEALAQRLDFAAVSVPVDDLT
jgi:hypothetical protein